MSRMIQDVVPGWSLLGWSLSQLRELPKKTESLLVVENKNM